MKLARGLRLLLAAALLAAWQAALVHPLAHVDAHGGFVHLGDGRAGAPDKTKPSLLCDAIAALAHCVGQGIEASFEAIASEFAASPPVAPDSSASPARHYLSQGPPAVL